MRETHVESGTLGNTRPVRTRLAGARDAPAVILLDAEYYLDRMDAARIIGNAAEEHGLTDANYIFVSHVDAEVRWTESFCNDRFASFLGSELIPHVCAEFELAPCSWYLGGLSLTGLSAMHAALTGPHPFDGVFAQSGSFWWQDNHFTNVISGYPVRDTRIRMSCGSLETQADVDHGGGLFQRTPQLESNEMLRDRLVELGYDVDFEIFDGGHDLASWSDELPRALMSLLSA